MPALRSAQFARLAHMDWRGSDRSAGLDRAWPLQSVPSSRRPLSLRGGRYLFCSLGFLFQPQCHGAGCRCPLFVFLVGEGYFPQGANGVFYFFKILSATLFRFQIYIVQSFFHLSKNRIHTTESLRRLHLFLIKKFDQLDDVALQVGYIETADLP